MDRDTPGPRPETAKLQCASCGAPLEVRNIQAAKMLHCHYCNATMQLKGGEATLSASSQAKPPKSALALGMVGAFSEGKFQIIGRIRFQNDLGEEWDEWLLLSQSGQYLWLQEDDWEFTLLKKFTPVNPIDPSQAGSYIDFEGELLEVEERAQCRIRFFEGELTWRAEVGEVVNYLDAWHGDDTVYSVEWTPEEIQFFKGSEIAVDDLYRAFAIGTPIPPEAYEEDEEEDEDEEEEGGATAWTKPAERTFARLLKGPTFRITLLSGILFMLIALFVTYATGAEVRPGKPPQVQATSILLGPYALTHAGRVHKITVSTVVNNREMYCEFNFLNDEMEEVAEFDHDFWHESGTDEDGAWSEKDIECYRYFKLPEGGTFYLEIMPQTTTPASFKVQIFQDTFSPAIFYILGIGALVYPSIILFFWLITSKSGSD